MFTMRAIHFLVRRHSAMIQPSGTSPHCHFEDTQMNKYAAIASLIAASAFATPAYSEFYRPTPKSTDQNDRKAAASKHP